MIIKASNKKWISPLVAFTATITAISGILLFLHLKSYYLYQMHQWGGILFLAATVIHLLLNWRPLTSYFQNRQAFTGILATACLLIFLMTVFPLQGKHGRRNMVQLDSSPYSHRYHR